MPEVWLPIIGYETLYEASNLGKIRRITTGRVLKPANADGYSHVTLSAYGVAQNHRVHVLVLTAFCGPPPFDGAEAAHNDGDTSNCRLTNLRWATKMENVADVDRHGRRCFGADVFGAILDDDKVATIRHRISQGERNPSIAKDFGVSVSTIHLIRHNRIWKHVKLEGKNE